MLRCAVLCLALLSCSDPDDDDSDAFIGPPAVPACKDVPRVAFACRDAGLAHPDGSVTGIECRLNVSDNSWPDGCAELSRSYSLVTYCCP